MEHKRFVSMIGMLVVMVSTMFLVSCASVQTRQYGVTGNDTIAINLTRDPNVGPVLITHINGEATGAERSNGFLGIGAKAVFVTPCYVKLTGKPIVLTVDCPVTEFTSVGARVVYKTTELRLTKSANIKPGDVFTLRWMYQTQTFAFIDATGNIIEQVVPTFF